MIDWQEVALLAIVVVQTTVIVVMKRDLADSDRYEVNKIAMQQLNGYREGLRIGLDEAEKIRPPASTVINNDSQ